ncbi:hypothetical protein GGI05_006347 [Coemansia sp. RSA 2603]|nr:hypothetical protein GGI05_006347 [Coemansia sp. RSA 2603]
MTSSPGASITNIHTISGDLYPVQRSFNAGATASSTNQASSGSTGSNNSNSNASLAPDNSQNNSSTNDTNRNDGNINSSSNNDSTTAISVDQDSTDTAISDLQDTDSDTSAIVIDEGDLATVDGSVVAIADLMTNSEESDIEITNVILNTMTDRQGNIVVSSDISVQTYAYTDYIGYSSPQKTTTTSVENTVEKATSSGGEKGLTRSEIIAISVSVPLLIILVSIGALFAYKWWSKRRIATFWNPAEKGPHSHMRIIDEPSYYNPDVKN